MNLSCIPTCARLHFEVCFTESTASEQGRQVSLWHKQTPVCLYQHWHIPSAAHNRGGRSLAPHVLDHHTSQESLDQVLI